jgi:GT2 family glycosyltransferase
MNIIFSLVLYCHPLSSIKPLLQSIQGIAASGSAYSFSLSVYNCSPIHLRHESSPSCIKPFLDNVDLMYTYGPNVGFGAANNRNFLNVNNPGESFFVVANPDISFGPDSLLKLFAWMEACPNLACVAPLVLNPGNVIQFSAKKNPTILSLFIGKFAFLRRFPLFSSYDAWHRNLAFDYRSECIYSTYLSGCFLVIPASLYLKANGFCERYFLHLEDADLVRRLSAFGLCVHNPIGIVEHQWARGSHHSPRQVLYLIHSIWVYFTEWRMTLF